VFISTCFFPVQLSLACKTLLNLWKVLCTADGVSLGWQVRQLLMGALSNVGAMAAGAQEAFLKRQQNREQTY
jgi:hypothetical protein